MTPPRPESCTSSARSFTRSAFAATTEEAECQRALAHLEQVIALEGPVVPDLLTFAKGVNSGYVPLGGVVINDAIYSTFADRPYPGGLPYSGHPLACAAAVATIETLENDRIIDHAAALGENVFGPGLRELAAKHDWIGDVRGTGAFWAIELVADRATREPLAPYGGTSPMAEIVAACQRRGLLPFANFNRIHVVPPLTTTAEEAREGIDILDQALTEARTTIV